MTQSMIIETGNILALNEAKKKASQNQGDELTETLKIVLSNSKGTGDNVTSRVNGDIPELQNNDRKNLKISIKVFISSPEAESLREALDHAFGALNTNRIESLVIAYSGEETSSDVLTALKSLWGVVETYVKLEKLSSVGLSDVNTNTFIEFYKWADVKPDIIQINLASCCVVPPALQKFTTDNDVQLLTHSDPSDILPEDVANSIFNTKVNVRWIVRYQIHLKCRGILSSKGYLLHIDKLPTDD